MLILKDNIKCVQKKNKTIYKMDKTKTKIKATYFINVHENKNGDINNDIK